MRVSMIEGTITAEDGTKSSFLIGPDGEWQQWGATQERLGGSVDAMSAMTRGLLEDGVLTSEDDEDDEDEEDDRG